MQRDKGKTWEQAVARAFRSIFGDDVRRGWQSRAGSDDPDIVGVPKFWVEAKHHKVVNIAEAIRQVLKAQKKHTPLRQALTGLPANRWPLVVSKSNRADPLATMLWNDFLELVKDWALLGEAVDGLSNRLKDLTPKRDTLGEVFLASKALLDVTLPSSAPIPDPDAMVRALARLKKAVDAAGAAPQTREELSGVPAPALIPQGPPGAPAPAPDDKY